MNQNNNPQLSRRSNALQLLIRNNYYSSPPSQLNRTPPSRSSSNLKEIEELNTYLVHVELMCKIYTNHKKLIKDKLRILGENTGNNN
jgi:hypothetical protein